MALSATCVHECRTTGLDDFNAVSAVVAVGGTLYTVGDVLTVSGGTSTTAATFTVTTVTAGVVTSVTPTNTGHYTVLPANPVSTTGGTGTLCTLTITWNAGGNGGIFDPGQVTNASNHAFTDLTTDTNTGNTATPIVSSVSYAFVAGDNGAWIYQATSGGAQGWINGWFQITAVSGGKATLNAAIGAVVLANYTLNTAVGISTNATPTGGIYAIDYSQQAGPQWNYTDLSSTGNGLTVSSAGHPFGRQQVGNSVCVMSGTTFTVGRYVIASVSGTTATVQGAANIHTGAGTNSDGAGAMGGPYQSPGQAFAVRINGNAIAVKSGTYSVISTTSNIPQGRLSLSGNDLLMGYATLRGDLGTSPVLQASGIATTTLVTCDGCCVNIKLDGAGLTSIQGFKTTSGNGQYLYKCTGINLTNNAFNTTTVCPSILCFASACTAQVAFSGVSFLYCVADSCTAGAFSIANNGGLGCVGCIASNTTGVGIQLGLGGVATNCTVYNSSSDGIKGPTSSSWRTQIINCISAKNSGWQINLSALASAPTQDWALVINNATWNSGGSGNINGTANFQSGNVVLGADPFVSAGSATTSVAVAWTNFALSTTTAGTACRAIGIVPFQDLGPVQHADPTVTAAFNPVGSAIVAPVREPVA